MNSEATILPTVITRMTGRSSIPTSSLISTYPNRIRRWRQSWVCVWSPPAGNSHFPRSVRTDIWNIQKDSVSVIRSSRRLLDVCCGHVTGYCGIGCVPWRAVCKVCTSPCLPCAKCNSISFSFFPVIQSLIFMYVHTWEWVRVYMHGYSCVCRIRKYWALHKYRRVVQVLVWGIFR